MFRLWAFLTVLFVAYGAWMISIAPPEERTIANLLPFLFWILFLGALTIRSKRGRADKIVRRNVNSDIAKII